MPTFKLDGQEIPFEEGDTIIRAAWRQGIEIPHYCWHPGLSVAANCRMCLVQITSGRQAMMPILKWDEKKQDYVPDSKPKLMPACQMAAAEGMEVESRNEEVQQAQKSVQEFLLLNHPVDCPICDQAGECKLQDYWLDHQHELKRKKTEPVHKPKGVRFGPTIVYDAERCIMCTRCIRVCDELVGDHVLDMRERSNKDEIILAPGRELDHKYTLMTEHVCPVGALTSRDFRFMARVWFLKSQPSVCPGCSTGCNMHADYDPRYNRVYRLRPRDNLQVNKFWMCDDGMMTYRRIHEERVEAGVLGRGDDAEAVTPEEAIEEAADALRGVDPSKLAVVLSAQHASEDNHALARLAKVRGVRVALVTGRDPRSLRKVAPVEGAWRAVEHGRRVVPPGERARPMRLSDDERGRLERFREWAQERAVPQGAALEDKPGSVAVHVRRLEARDRERARRVLQQARRRASELDLHPREGRAVCEAEVRGGDKGEALDEVVRTTGAAGVVYAGDDKTDYPAIRRAVEHGGVGIFVRSKERRRTPAAASATVGGPEEIAELVEALLDALKTPARGRPGRSQSKRRGRGRRSPKR
ncbi:MAG: 2Fe-2S iron-sulfur cluster-binding protein [Polyangiales bacterium]